MHLNLSQIDSYASFLKVKIIVTNAFRKKGQKLPKNEKELALKYRADYLLRTKAGEYYE